MVIQLFYKKKPFQHHVEKAFKLYTLKKQAFLSAEDISYLLLTHISIFLNRVLLEQR